jgi:hypothetical protein
MKTKLKCGTVGEVFRFEDSTNGFYFAHADGRFMFDVRRVFFALKMRVPIGPEAVKHHVSEASLAGELLPFLTLKELRECGYPKSVGGLLKGAVGINSKDGLPITVWHAGGWLFHVALLLCPKVEIDGRHFCNLKTPPSAFDFAAKHLFRFEWSQIKAISRPV